MGRYVRPWSGFQIWLFRIRRRRKSKGGAVVRTLASHQCGPGSNPGLNAICGLSLLLVLSFAPRGFSPGSPVFPSPQKPTLPNSNSFWKAWTCLNEFILTPMCFVGKQANYNFCFFKAMSLLVFNPSLCHSLSSFYLSYVTVSRPFHFSEIYPNRASL